MNNGYEIIYDVVDGKYEYDRILLDEMSSKYIYIPMSIIVDNEFDIRRIGVFSYLRIHCGLNNIVNFTVSDIVEWCGGKPDRTINGSNNKTLLTMDALSDKGYLTFLTEKSRSSYMKCKLDTENYYNECSEGYSVLYLDEIDKIINYKRDNIKDNTINNMSILLVFAYLRNKIWRRPNELKIEERYPDRIKDRRERLPDAFDSNINDIAVDIGISSKTVSKIIDILEYELLLIVTDRAYRIKDVNNKFKTLPTIFVNSYKREDKYLLACGEEYSRSEIELKAQNMRQLYQDYKIDKRKRKNKKQESD